MELVHICGPARSLDKNIVPSIGDEMYFHPKKNVWYAGDDEGETTVIMRFCPFCGLKLSTLEMSDQQGVEPTPESGQMKQSEQTK